MLDWIRKLDGIRFGAGVHSGPQETVASID
jgi:hypothetical protein